MFVKYAKVHNFHDFSEAKPNIFIIISRKTGKTGNDINLDLTENTIQNIILEEIERLCSEEKICKSGGQRVGFNTKSRVCIIKYAKFPLTLQSIYPDLRTKLF